MLNNSNYIQNKNGEEKTIVIDETSICIPRVLKHISNDFIVDIFQNKINLGIVTATSVKNKLLHDTTIKIVYNYPWFWKCTLNKNGRKSYK